MPLFDLIDLGNLKIEFEGVKCIATKKCVFNFLFYKN